MSMTALSMNAVRARRDLPRRARSRSHPCSHHHARAPAGGGRGRRADPSPLAIAVRVCRRQRACPPQRRHMGVGPPVDRSTGFLRTSWAGPWRYTARPTTGLREPPAGCPATPPTVSLVLGFGAGGREIGFDLAFPDRRFAGCDGCGGPAQTGTWPRTLLNSSTVAGAGWRPNSMRSCRTQIWY